MLSKPIVALDLPLRVVVWQESDNTVWVGYHDMAELVRYHGITDRGETCAAIWRPKGVVVQPVSGCLLAQICPIIRSEKTLILISSKLIILRIASLGFSSAMPLTKRRKNSQGFAMGAFPIAFLKGSTGSSIALRNNQHGNKNRILETAQP